jgi:hypothetical protein
MLSEPAALAGLTQPPDDLQALPFSNPQPLTADNLRRLSGAAAFERALVGVRLGAEDRFEIWGVVHSGERWLRALEGSCHSFPALPPALVINAIGPGNLTVGKGSLVVARLLGGQLVMPMPSVLEVDSPDGEDPEINRAFLTAHRRTRDQRGREWARIDVGLVDRIRRRSAMRLISAMRQLNHGGTLIMLPTGLAGMRPRWQEVLNLKYAFPEGPTRRWLFNLIVCLIEALAKDCGERFGSAHQATWRDYLATNDPEVRRADEAITEAIRFLACLSAVDGAVVLGPPMELLGFGAEISGRLPPVDHVARALDPSASSTVTESVLNVGTRHRSAYRLCQALPGAVAAVVSQDGSMRIVRRIANRVVYSDHLGTGALDL